VSGSTVKDALNTLSASVSSALAPVSGTNFGGGQQIFASVSGSRTLNFRTLAVTGSLLTVSTLGDVVLISSSLSSVSASGIFNDSTVSGTTVADALNSLSSSVSSALAPVSGTNFGFGTGVFASVSGSRTLNFKSLTTTGSALSLSQSGDTLILSSAVPTGSNVGGGAEIFAGISGSNVFNFRTITTTGSLTAQVIGNVVRLSASHGAEPLGDGTDHALATSNPGGVAGFMSPEDKTNLVAVRLATKFFPPTSNAVTIIGDFATISVGANANLAITFEFPDDYVSLSQLVVVGWPNASFTAQDIDLTSDYGAVGELYNANSSADATGTYSGVINTVFELSIANLFPSASAGDYAAAQVDHNAIGTTVNYIGIRMQYLRS
jgi:hypothetical protein